MRVPVAPSDLHTVAILKYCAAGLERDQYRVIAAPGGPKAQAAELDGSTVGRPLIPAIEAGNGLALWPAHEGVDDKWDVTLLVVDAIHRQLDQLTDVVARLMDNGEYILWPESVAQRPIGAFRPAPIIYYRP